LVIIIPHVCFKNVRFWAGPERVQIPTGPPFIEFGTLSALIEHPLELVEFLVFLHDIFKEMRKEIEELAD